MVGGVFVIEVDYFGTLIDVCVRNLICWMREIWVGFDYVHFYLHSNLKTQSKIKIYYQSNQKFEHIFKFNPITNKKFVYDSFNTVNFHVYPN